MVFIGFFTKNPLSVAILAKIITSFTRSQEGEDRLVNCSPFEAYLALLASYLYSLSKES